MLKIFITIIFVLASLALHESAHILAVKFLGGKIERVGIFPLGFFAKARRLETLSSYERYVIYFAGPAANFTVALWAFATSQLSYVGIEPLDGLAFYNFAIGLFNLMPVLPLDGGRILLQFLGNKYGILRAGRLVKRLGILLSYVFIFFGILQILFFPYNLTLFCAGIFLLKKNKKIASELHAAFHLALAGKNSPNRARILPVKKIALPAEIGIKYAMERLAFDYFITFYIDAKSDRPLREEKLLKYIFKNGINGTIGEIVS
jgi:stage IV sporulation protein FB